VNSLLGQESVSSILGPLSPTLSGCKIFFQSVLAYKPWDYDPVALRLPWNENGYQLVEHGGGKKLVFGFMWDDKWLKPHPPVWRAMQMVKDAVIAAGHKGQSNVA
jgi:amidase